MQLERVGNALRGIPRTISQIMRNGIDVVPYWSHLRACHLDLKRQSTIKQRAINNRPYILLVT